MSRRRIAALALTIGLGTTATALTTTVAIAGEKKPDFSKLKEIEEPDPCKNDQGVTDDTIKVGVITIESGPAGAGFAPGAEQGIQARFDKANAEGELGDRTIEFTVADDTNDSARNLTAARQLNEEEKIFGIISLTGVAKGGAGYLNEEGIPVTGWHTGENVWGIYPNMFSWRPTQAPDNRTVFTTRNADLLKELGAKRIAVVGSNVESSAINADQAATAVEKTKGLKLVFKTTDVTVEQQDFTGIAAQIKEAKADGVYTSTGGLQANGLTQALDQAGIELKAIVFPGGYDDRVTGLPGYDGAYIGTEFVPLEVGSPGLTEYTEAMESHGFETLRFFALHGWFSADAFVEGIKAAGVSCPTRKAFINNLRLVKGYDAGGSFLPVDYAKVFGRPAACFYYVQVQNQEFVPIFDGEPFCATQMVEDGEARKLKPSEIKIG
ncbi:MAG: ABC transporter substrate-binding protein [Acidimicrobiia bacterium]